MKKTIFFLSILFTLIIAGCNQKHLINQIDGTWHVQKYTVSGADKTPWFDSTYAGFQWTFSGGISFHKNWNTVQLFTIYNYDTVAHYDTTTHMFVIDSVITSHAIVPTSSPVQVSGDWYLTNGNEWLETRDSIYGDLLYQILDHSGSSLHLVYGNQDYYLSH